MAHSFESHRAVAPSPAHLGFLAIYNPSLGTSDDTLENQIVYYTSTEIRDEDIRLHQSSDPQVIQDAAKEKKNEQLRQIGLAQGMVEFGRTFSEGKAVDTVETEKSRIVLHELEAGWWILASINLTVLPVSNKAGRIKSGDAEATIEYSSRDVKPSVLLLGDLLQAHTTFLLHHAASLSALFVRTQRSKFMAIMARYWDSFLSTWNVRLHGNPANSLYGGIKIAACGELGMGVGEEERGSGEREVLEGFVGRIEGMVDIVVSRFGSEDPAKDAGHQPVQWAPPVARWLGSGNDPAAEDGVVFLGTGALSRKSLRDISHWMEDIYKWGPHAYGVLENPTSNRRAKRSKGTQKDKRRLSPEAKARSRQVYGISTSDTPSSPRGEAREPTHTPPAAGSNEYAQMVKSRPPIHRNPSSHYSTGSDSGKTNTFMQYLKFGYGKHWSLGTLPSKKTSEVPVAPHYSATGETIGGNDMSENHENLVDTVAPVLIPLDDSAGHYLIGLLGDLSQPAIEGSDLENEPVSNSRLLLRTLTVELEREVDARAEGDISIDLGNFEINQGSSTGSASERTGISNNSFDSQDRNKTKKLRVVVYARRPFIFAFLVELRTDTLALKSFYRSIHSQISPLIKPLLASTSFRASKPDIGSEDSETPIYDLVWDPKFLTINSTIPNIPDHSHGDTKSTPWSRVDAMNTHVQIINTFSAAIASRSETERTSKTSRGWWVVWTKIPDPDFDSTTSLTSGAVHIPEAISEDSGEPHKSTSSSKRNLSTKNSLYSGPAHPFLEAPASPHDLMAPKDKEIFLIRRASDHLASQTQSRFTGRTASSSDIASSTRLAQGIGVDTKRYIESLLNMNR